MIETKQLQYFVICADLQSFSKAADALYTTQPNVSKVIKSLEEELGFPLFVRQSKGISLTGRGRHVYEYACKAIDQIQQLSDFARMDKGEELRFSCNPSSWMAAVFAEFYNVHQAENVCFRVMTASTEDVIKRCADGKDDIGFVHVMESQISGFRYKLERSHLEFTELKRIRAMLYFGRNNPLAAEKFPENLPREKVRLVQCYEDEFTLNRYANLFTGENEKRPGRKVAVITNSDYVMNELLQKTDLGNISGEYLSHRENVKEYPGISLYGDEEPVLFGYIRREQEELSKWAESFLGFMKERMKGSQ